MRIQRRHGRRLLVALGVGLLLWLVAACAEPAAGGQQEDTGAATSDSGGPGGGALSDGGALSEGGGGGEADSGPLTEDAEGRLAEIAHNVKTNGLFSEIVGVGGDPETVFYGCWNSGASTYLAGTGGTVVGTAGLSWKTLTEGSFPTLQGMAGSDGGAYLHAVGLSGAIIGAKRKGEGLAENWGPPGGCSSAGDCDDQDGCTTDFCDSGVCKHVSSKAAGCCGSIPLADAFDHLGNWTVTDLYAGRTHKGGIVWTAASVHSVTGAGRWTSPKRALYFGLSDQPCKADPSKICPTYDNGKVVGSRAVSAPFELPEADRITLTFELLMDVRDNYYDDLRIYVVQGNSKTTVWYKQKNNSNKGTTGGKFVLQTVDLGKFAGKTVQLELRFDTRYHATGQMGGEGVYIDDLMIATKCASGSVAGKGLSEATFFDVWAASDDAAWAVGTGGTIARWDGQEWKLETGQAVREIRALGGVPGQGRFAVGDQGLIAGFSPGGLKTLAKSPVTTNLYAVAATPGATPEQLRALAVGNAGTVVEYAKGTWSKKQFPIPLSLRAVAADGKGGYLVAGGSVVFIRSAAGIWTQVGNLSGGVYAAAFLGGGKYLVVGGAGKNAEVGPLSFTPGSDMGSINLRALWALAAKDVWVAGDQATVANFNGAIWVPKPTPFSEKLRAVWAADDQHVFVGGLGGRLASFDGAEWKKHEDFPGLDVHALWGSDPNDVYAALKGGILARWDGKAWQVIAGPVTGNLRAVWGSSATDVWAVGEGAHIYHSGGDGSWGPVAIEPYQPDPKEDPKEIKEDLYAIWGSGPDDIWAAGAPDKHSYATLLHYGGKTWGYIPALDAETRVFRAIWGWNKGSVLFAGTRGMLYHYDGSEFTEVKPGSITTFFDICSYGKDAVLVGGIGTVIRYIPPAHFRAAPDGGERSGGDGG